MYKKLLQVFILALFVLPVFVHAALPAGCQASYKFSPFTGQACTDTPVQDCASGDLFSTVTGQSCSNIPTFPEGCTSLIGYSATTGKKCNGSTPVQQQINQIQTQVNQIIHTLPSLIPPSNTNTRDPDDAVRGPVVVVPPAPSVSTIPSISVNATGEVCTANNQDTSSTMICNIQYSITANGTTIYIPKTVSLVSNSNSSMSFSIQKASGSPSETLISSISDGQFGTEWTIPVGQGISVNATLTINDPNNSNPGLYRAFISSIPWGITSGAYTNIYTSGLGSINPAVPGYSQLN